MSEKKNKSQTKKSSQSNKEFYNLFENELESDVTLLVGQDGWQERVPAHSWVLANGSDYFRALLQGPFAHCGGNIHRFPDDPKGFNNLIRWLYQNKCDLQSVQSSLDTLSVSIKYLCPELAEFCIIRLTNQLTVINVLKILSWIYFYCSNYQHPNPSAPSLEEMEENSLLAEKHQLIDHGSQDPTLSCHILLNECLDLIDKNSDEVLTSEHLSTADLPVLHMIFKRDTLNLSSELKILKAMHKWATAACKREQLPLTLENKRKVLGHNLYLAKLLILTPAEVEILKTKYQENLSLLTEEELNYVSSVVNKKSPKCVPPETLKPHIETMSQTRNKKDNSSKISDSLVNANKLKKKTNIKKRFNKKEIILDLVTILGLIFD